MALDGSLEYYILGLLKTIIKMRWLFNSDYIKLMREIFSVSITACLKKSVSSIEYNRVLV